MTDHIDRFTEQGILTKSGRVTLLVVDLTRIGKLLEADLVVSATGLTLQKNFPMSTVKVDVDGKPNFDSKKQQTNRCPLRSEKDFLL